MLFAGAGYTSVTDAVFPNSTVLGLGPNPTNTADYTGETFLELMFLNPLTDAGGTDTVFAVEFIWHRRHLRPPNARAFLEASSPPLSPPRHSH